MNTVNLSLPMWSSIYKSWWAKIRMERVGDSREKIAYMIQFSAWTAESFKNDFEKDMFVI